MTAFELRGLAVISRVLFNEISKTGKLTNKNYRVDKVGGAKTMTFFVHEISWSSIDIEDQETRLKIYSEKAKPGTLFTLRSEERRFNELWIEQGDNPYLKGRDNYGRFEVRAQSYNRYRVKDDSDNVEYEYEIS